MGKRRRRHTSCGPACRQEKLMTPEAIQRGMSFGAGDYRTGKRCLRDNYIRTHRPDRFLLTPGIYSSPAVLIRRMVGLQ